METRRPLPIMRRGFQHSVPPVERDGEKDRSDFDTPSGSLDYREYVGTSETYDIGGAIQFNLLTTLGLREHHRLLDVGCGSLRAGRLFIPYLLKGSVLRNRAPDMASG